jgi:hypothetical protein
MVVGQLRLEPVEDAVAAQPARGRVQSRVELVQPPSQPSLQPGALGDQVAAVVDKQLDLAGGSVELGDRQIGVAQRGNRDRFGVDRIGLARTSSTPTGAGHELVGTRTTRCPRRADHVQVDESGVGSPRARSTPAATDPTTRPARGERPWSS